MGQEVGTGTGTGTLDEWGLWNAAEFNGSPRRPGLLDRDWLARVILRVCMAVGSFFFRADRLDRRGT